VRRALALALAATALAGCSRPRPAITDCEAAADARPICGFHNPEDLALLPNAKVLVVSEMGTGLDGSTPGALEFLDLASEAKTRAFPLPGSADAVPVAGWGDPACTSAPGDAFSPHGLDLAKRPDGALALLVVNHGGRESVELFEVTDAPGAPALEWRGCVRAPEDAMLNDVAALPDGGFVATRFLSKPHPLRDTLLGVLGFSTGHVLEWQHGSGFRKVPYSDAPAPNGIAVSPDGEKLYVDVYLGDEVRVIARRSGEVLGSVEVASPDNLNWTSDGKLLVASHNAPINEVMACGQLEKGQCPFHFAIMLLDPVELRATAVYQNAGPPMGAGTSALRIGDELWIGTFAGDRLLRAKLPDWVAKTKPS